jgi:hypothetical protein
VTARKKQSVGGAKSAKTRLRVGVTLYIRDENQTIWENGIFQNTFFLLNLLKQSSVIEWCCVVAGGPGDPKAARDLLGHSDVDVISMSEALDTLDLVIELSAQLDPEWGRTFVERGHRIIAMRVANDFVIDAERMAFGLPAALVMSGVPYQEVWTLPAFARTCASYYEAGYRAPVRVMQHLWSPELLNRSLATRAPEATFAYVPGRARWRAAVMEPNLCSVKTCHIPLLVCDVAYRLRPTSFEVVRIFNTVPLRDNEIFIHFARSTHLVRNGLATFEGRFPTYTVMGEMADVIVSHHWENAQNYLYYEALYGGFPLVHNSDLIDDCGYRYRDLDPQDGGRALIQALAQHDRNLDAYKAGAQRFLAKLCPMNEDNVRQYSEAIWNAWSAGRGEGAAGGSPNVAMVAA